MADDAAALLCTPGMKPGISTRVSRGMLNTLQKRMNRAALSEESMSSVPALTAELFATIPMTIPWMRANPMTIFLPKSATSRKSPPSTSRAMTCDIERVLVVFRHYFIQFRIGRHIHIGGGMVRRVQHIVGGKEGEELRAIRTASLSFRRENARCR